MKPFVEAVLLSLARRNVVSAHGGVVGPGQDGVGRIFRPVVSDELVRPFPPQDDDVELVRHPTARQPDSPTARQQGLAPGICGQEEAGPADLSRRETLTERPTAGVNGRGDLFEKRKGLMGDWGRFAMNESTIGKDTTNEIEAVG